jgi:hypothetical protein
MSRRMLVILTVLLALVVLRVRATPDGPRGFGFPDAYHYAEIGRQLARGEGLTTLQTYPYILAWYGEAGLDRTPPWPNVARFPLLPLVYAPVFRIAGATEGVVRRIGEAFWIGTAVATALLASLLFGSGVALVATAFQLASLAPVGLARSGLPDGPAALAILASALGVALLTRAAASSENDVDAHAAGNRARSARIALVLGVVLGAAFLLRYDLLALLAAALVVLVWRRSAMGWWQAALVLAGFALPVGAWLLHDALVTGAPGTYLGLDRNLLGSADAADVYASISYQDPWPVLLRDQALLAQKIDQLVWPLHRWRDLFGWSLAWLGPLALLSCVGLVWTAHPAARMALFVALAFALRSLLFSVTHHELRFYASFAPALLVIALGGVASIVERWPIPGRVRIALAVLLVACFAATQVPTREVANAHRFAVPPDPIFDAIRERTPARTVIATRDLGLVAWLAERPSVNAQALQIADTERLGLRIDGLLYPSAIAEAVRSTLTRQNLDGEFVEVSSGPRLTLWLRNDLVAQWNARASTPRAAQAG